MIIKFKDFSLSKKEYNLVKKECESLEITGKTELKGINKKESGYICQSNNKDYYKLTKILADYYN